MRPAFALSSRSRLLSFLGADALLSLILMACIFNYVESRIEKGPHRVQLERAGAISMTESEMMVHIHSQGRTAFWLRPHSKARYAIADMDPRQLIITYLLPGDDLYSAAQSKMTIQTFPNWASFQDATHLDLDSASTRRYQTNSGNTVILDTSRIESEIVTFPWDPSVVLICYTNPPSPQEMLGNADKLVSVV